ncbi:MAG: hypothetical protein NTY30_00535 [Candidatus Berkelbacteria bacterium]|nr:hypothetical protein [Candidatus Berkelbacteria bacterium]
MRFGPEYPNNPNIKSIPNANEFDVDDSEPFVPPIDEDKSRKDALRLLGLDRNYRTLVPDQDKQEYLVAAERISAYENIDTTTNPRQRKIDQKKGIVSEIVKENLISPEILKGYITVYLGSGTDVEYPLAIGARHLKMVDYILDDPKAQQEILERLERILGTKVSIEENEISFPFDFGEGAETVRIELDALTYTPEIEVEGTQDGVGLIICYAAQGPSGKIEIGDNLKSQVVQGGVIIKDSQVIRLNTETGEEEIEDIGTRES